VGVSPRRSKGGERQGDQGEEKKKFFGEPLPNETGGWTKLREKKRSGKTRGVGQTKGQNRVTRERTETKCERKKARGEEEVNGNNQSMEAL